jgi:hypothetical protein
MRANQVDALQARQKVSARPVVAAPNAAVELTHQLVLRAAQDVTRLRPGDVATLQHTIGNQAVTRMVRGGGLRVGAANDRYEHEADQIVDTRFGHAPAQTHGTAPTGVQRSVAGPGGGVADRAVARRLAATSKSGRELPETVRRSLEPTLGADLSGVKVHTDSRAVQLTRDLGAKAFTHKNHIYYGAGQSPGDLRLTAHEAVHTLQQGAADMQRAAADDVAANDVAAPERDKAGPAQRGRVGVSPAPAGQIQREWWWDRRKRRQKNMTDVDVAPEGYSMGEGGTANRVDKVRYNRGIGKSKEKSGFFKPNTMKGMSDRAVVSSRLDKWLGTNILSDEVYAEHGGEKGSVSAKVEGKPLFERQFNTPVPEGFDINNELDPSQYKKHGDTYKKYSGDRFMQHDFSNPVTQKGMSDLQLLDAITGQSDRHGGNIYIDPKTGKVKGIDNDFAFSKGEDLGSPFGKYHDLPNLVDEKTAKMILKKKAKNLPKVLRSKYGGGLTDQEITNSQTRLRAVKTYLKQLKKDKKLVKNWDDTTYISQVMEGNRTDKFNNPNSIEPSYLKRSVMQWAGGTDREGLDDEEAMFHQNPLYEEELG